MKLVRRDPGQDTAKLAAKRNAEERSGRTKLCRKA